MGRQHEDDVISLFPNAWRRVLVFFLGGLGVVDCLVVVLVLFSNRIVPVLRSALCKLCSRKM